MIRVSVSKKSLKSGLKQYAYLWKGVIDLTDF